jgi:hypothetical protein
VGLVDCDHLGHDRVPMVEGFCEHGNEHSGSVKGYN